MLQNKQTTEEPREKMSLQKYITSFWPVLILLVGFLIWTIVLYVSYYQPVTLIFSGAGLFVAAIVWICGWYFKQHPNEFLRYNVGYTDIRSIVWDPQMRWRMTKTFRKWIFLDFVMIDFSNPDGIVANFIALENPVAYQIVSQLMIVILLAQIGLFATWFFQEYLADKFDVEIKGPWLIYAINTVTFVQVLTFLILSLPSVEFFEQANLEWMSLIYVAAVSQKIPRLFMHDLNRKDQRLSELAYENEVPHLLKTKIEEELSIIEKMKSRNWILVICFLIGFFYQFARVLWSVVNLWIYFIELRNIRTQTLAFKTLELEEPETMYKNISITEINREKRRMNNVLDFSEVMHAQAQNQHNVRVIQRKLYESRKKAQNLLEKIEKITQELEEEKIKTQEVTLYSIKIKTLAQDLLAALHRRQAKIKELEAEKTLEEALALKMRGAYHRKHADKEKQRAEEELQKSEALKQEISFSKEKRQALREDIEQNAENPIETKLVEVEKDLNKSKQVQLN